MSSPHTSVADVPSPVPTAVRPRLPDWLRIKLPTTQSYVATRSVLGELRLHTVCESAKCPNHWECWSKGTATFMIAGDRCTRACGFCAVDTAKPLPLEADEPQRVAEATRRMRLKHVVITAVARDDLADGGAEHFQRTVDAVRKLNPGIVIEVLTPDFNDREESLAFVVAARPNVFNHNLETVRRLTPSVRHRATYDRSLSVLRKVKAQAPGSVSTFNRPCDISPSSSLFLRSVLKNWGGQRANWDSSTSPVARKSAVRTTRTNSVTGLPVPRLSDRRRHRVPLGRRRPSTRDTDRQLQPSERPIQDWFEWIGRGKQVLASPRAGEMNLRACLSQRAASNAVPAPTCSV